MSTFLLLHGASADSGYWRFVVPALEALGHAVVAPDLPTADEGACFLDYADAALAASGGRDVDVVVGQSMGAFTAGVVASRLDIGQVVLLCPMIPAPDESPGEWAEAVGQREAVQSYATSIGVSAEFDAMSTMFHDVPDEVRAELWNEGEPAQAESIFTCPFPLSMWPAAPTRVVAGALDRLFPLALQRRVARDRLGVEVEVIDTGHLAAFARPDLVVDALAR